MCCVVCLREVITSIDVSREVCKIILVEDSLRCIYIRDRISCLGQIDVLLNDVTLDSGNRSLIIYNDNVNTIVSTVSIGYINVGNRSWCNCFPESSCVSQTQSLLLIPVNCSCWSISCTQTSCAVDTGVIDKVQCNRCSECSCVRTFLIGNSSFGRSTTNGFNTRNNLNIKCATATIYICLLYTSPSPRD